jgi:hypothetical protein
MKRWPCWLRNDASFHCGTNPGGSVLTTFQGDDLIRWDNLGAHLVVESHCWHPQVGEIPCSTVFLKVGAPVFTIGFPSEVQYTNKELGLFLGSLTSGNLHKYGGQIPCLLQKSPILRSWINSPFCKIPFFLSKCHFWVHQILFDLAITPPTTSGTRTARSVGPTLRRWLEWLGPPEMSGWWENSTEKPCFVALFGNGKSLDGHFNGEKSVTGEFVCCHVWFWYYAKVVRPIMCSWNSGTDGW